MRHSEKMKLPNGLMLVAMKGVEPIEVGNMVFMPYFVNVNPFLVTFLQLVAAFSRIAHLLDKKYFMIVKVVAGYSIVPPMPSTIYSAPSH